MSLHNGEPDNTRDSLVLGLNTERLSQNVCYGPLSFLEWLDQTTNWVEVGNDFLATMLVRGLGFAPDVTVASVADKNAAEIIDTLSHYRLALSDTDPTKGLIAQMIDSYRDVFLTPATAIMLPLNQYPWFERTLPGSGNLACTSNGSQRRAIYQAMFFIMELNKSPQDKKTDNQSTTQSLLRGLKPAILTIYHPQLGDTVNDAMVIKPYDFNWRIGHLVRGLISDDDLRWPNVIQTLHGRILHA